MSEAEPRHPINYVSQRTGLSTHVIRVWERRYGAVTPVRTPTNRRLYSDLDIQRLQLLKDVTRAGHSIGHIATLPNEELLRLTGGAFHSAHRSAPAAVADTHRPSDATTPGEFLERSKRYVVEMDRDALSSLLVEASIRLSQFSLLEDYIAPLMIWVGDEWHAGRLRIAQEHFTSAAVRTFLGNFHARSDQSDQAPVILVATPSGHLHEIGALLAANVAAIEGWHDIYFGANLPVQEIANAARESRARAVALSVAYVTDAGSFLHAMETVRHYLPATVDLVIGGAGAVAHREALRQKGIWSCDNLTEFRDVLRELIEPSGDTAGSLSSRENGATRPAMRPGQSADG